MAAPKIHAIPTAALLGISLALYTPTALLGCGTATLSLILFFGIFMDGDHLSIRRIKKIMRGEKGPVEGWINWMHTWQALVGVIIISVLHTWQVLIGVITVSALIASWLPFASYATHVLIDGGDISNLKYKTSPLPRFLHRFCPRWAKYETGIII